MQPAFISFRSSQVHYSYGGNGQQVLLCLHGYGETENSFHFLEKYLPAGFRIMAIDLPFHGKTIWKEQKDFTVEQLVALVDAVFDTHELSGTSFTLLGFSMGGRMALSILQAIPQRVNKMILLAPDGLKVNAWYWLATQTYPGHSLFKFTMKHPGWFFGLLNLGNAFKFINPSVYKFTRYYVDNAGLRQQLFQRWSGLRKIKPDLADIKAKIKKHKIPVELVYGKFDRIIRHERGEKFRKGIESYCHLQILQAGHQLLQEKNAALITGLL
jgi:pimeloyl-ACP methyl ester carboxylesterase